MSVREDLMKILPALSLALMLGGCGGGSSPPGAVHARGSVHPRAADLRLCDELDCDPAVRVRDRP